jgi:hypothetical protein
VAGRAANQAAGSARLGGKKRPLTGDDADDDMQQLTPEAVPRNTRVQAGKILVLLLHLGATYRRLPLVTVGNCRVLCLRSGVYSNQVHVPFAKV